MADHTPSTHLEALRTVEETTDPAVAAYHRLRAAVADGGDVAAAEDALIATRAASPAGVGAKLVELAGHEGWFAHPEYHQTRLVHSALADLSAMGGAA